MVSPLTLFDLVAVALAVWLLQRLFSSRSSKRLPPGPKPWPIIGNVLDVPSKQAWKTYAQWSERWGHIVSLDILGQPMIILSSLKAAVDLLEKQSAIYSDRPRSVCAGEIVGYDRTLVLAPYSPRMRAYRKMFAKCIGTRALVEEHSDLMLQAVRDYLFDVHQAPERLKDHIRRMTSRNILLISHGYRVQSADDRFLQYGDQCSNDFSELATPGAVLVDFFPALRYVPSCMPGTGWKRWAAKCRETLLAAVDEPLQWVKREMATGTALSSFTSRNLEIGNSSEEHEDYVKYAAMSLYSAGSDTTVSALCSFYLAMTLYPEVQQKAQAEIDAIIGNDRLPTFQDRNRLPYINALCLEILRWLPVGPLGVPHRLTEDDVYEGYFLPKGSIVIVNNWKLLHDPEVYPDPMRFSPERFMREEPDLDPTNIAFGYGRRICPGNLVAQSTLFITVATSLAVFGVSPKVANGKPVLPSVEQTSGIISFPTPFECSIKLRSSKAAAFLTSSPT